MNPGVVNMYVCGVTVYDLCHLGHARCYLAFDLIHRWLERSGYDVNYVQNFTDIDDKIINRANETGQDWKQLVDENIATYYRDMDALNILRADKYPRCTEYVDDMIRIIEDLVDRVMPMPQRMEFTLALKVRLKNTVSSQDRASML